MQASAASFEARKRQVLDFLVNLAPQDEQLLQSIEHLIFAELEIPDEKDISAEQEKFINGRRKKFLVNPEVGIPWEVAYQKLKNKV